MNVTLQDSLEDMRDSFAAFVEAPSNRTMDPIRHRMDTAIDQLLGGLATSSPPIDVKTIAANQLAIEVREKRMTGHGGLLVDRGDTVHVLLNSEDPPYRKRFSLAHEIGHLFLRKGSLYGRRGLSSLPGSKSRFLEERLCHEFARRLLMPESMMQQLPNPRKVDFVLLEALSLRFHVSQEVVARRLITDRGQTPTTLAIVARHNPSGLSYERSIRGRLLPRAITGPAVLRSLHEPVVLANKGRRNWSGEAQIGRHRVAVEAISPNQHECILLATPALHNGNLPM